MGIPQLKSFSDGMEGGAFSVIPYYQASLRFYEQVLIAKQNLLNREESLRLEAVEYGADENALIYSGARKELMELDDLSRATQIFACLAVESFINFYGVVCFGEDVYKETYERITPIRKKLKKIMTASLGNKTVNSMIFTNILDVLKRMFSKRNILVHPKAQENQGGRKKQLTLHISADFPFDDAEKMLYDMKLFFELFVQLDAETSGIIHYLTQNKNHSRLV